MKDYIQRWIFQLFGFMDLIVFDFLFETIHIGIVGSRDRNSRQDFDAVNNKLIEIVSNYHRDINYTLVSGGCKRGADSFIHELASKLSSAGFLVNSPTIHLPNTKKIDENRPYRSEYRRVAYERNTLIAEDSDILIACVRPDRMGGTEDTIKKFINMGKKENLYLV